MPAESFIVVERQCYCARPQYTLRSVLREPEIEGSYDLCLHLYRLIRSIERHRYACRGERGELRLEHSDIAAVTVPALHSLNEGGHRSFDLDHMRSVTHCFAVQVH